MDPRAGVLCTSCNSKKPTVVDVRLHCDSPGCSWWRCGRCSAVNDSTGSNNVTNRNGTPRPGTMPLDPRVLPGAGTSAA